MVQKIFQKFIGTLVLLPLFGAAGIASADVRVINSGTVINSTSASSNSGGQSVSGGERTTTGKSSASVHTTIVSDGEGSTVEIMKTVNGETTHETYTAGPGEAVSVKATSSAQGEKSLTTGSVNIHAETAGGEASSTASMHSEGGTSTEAASESTCTLSVGAKISAFFERLFGFFGR